MLTFGSDPEYFITETIENKKWAVPVPYFIENGLTPEIGYDETRKHPVILKTEHSKVIMDGVAAEFNVLPAHDSHSLYLNIREAADSLHEFCNRFGYDMTIEPTVYYDFMKYYRVGVKTLEWCGVFGCDPDRDAIVDEYASPTIDVTNHLYRYGGGHLHISDENELIKNVPIPFIRCLALTVGNFSIAHSPFPELERLRAFRYGQPGRFRVQHYPDGNIGVEYRSPSNVWTSNEDLVSGMLEQAYKAYELIKNPEHAVELLTNYLDLTCEAIGEGSAEKAAYVLSKIN